MRKPSCPSVSEQQCLHALHVSSAYPVQALSTKTSTKKKNLGMISIKFQLFKGDACHAVVNHRKDGHQSQS